MTAARDAFGALAVALGAVVASGASAQTTAEPVSVSVSGFGAVAVTGVVVDAQGGAFQPPSATAMNT